MALFYLIFTVKMRRCHFKNYKHIFTFISFARLCNINSIAKSKGGENTMSRSNKVLVPGAKQDLDNFKMEVAKSLNVDLKQGYNGDIKAKDAGSVGGEMVKRMIAYAENNMSGSGNNMMR